MATATAVDAIVAVGAAAVGDAEVGVCGNAVGVDGLAVDAGVPTDVEAAPGVEVAPTANPLVAVDVAMSADETGVGPATDPPTPDGTGVALMVALGDAAIDVAVAADGVETTVAGVAMTVDVTANVAEPVAVATAVAVGVAVGVGDGATKSISDELELVRPAASYATTDTR